MFHCVATNEGSCATEACFAVDCECVFTCLCDLKEFVDDITRGTCAIGEVKIMMVDPVFYEIVSVVGYSIEPNHTRNPKLLENGQVVLWRQVDDPLLIFLLPGRRAKSYKLVRHNPIQIPILDLLIMIILGNIKFLKIEPSQLHRILKPPQTVQYGTFIGARPIAGISEGHKLELSERLPDFISSSVVQDHLR